MKHIKQTDNKVLHRGTTVAARLPCLSQHKYSMYIIVKIAWSHDLKTMCSMLMRIYSSVLYLMVQFYQFSVNCGVQPELSMKMYGAGQMGVDAQGKMIFCAPAFRAWRIPSCGRAGVSP